MQSDKITIRESFEGFTIIVDEEYYHFSRHFEDVDYEILFNAITHITSDTVDIERVTVK